MLYALHDGKPEIVLADSKLTCYIAEIEPTLKPK